MPPTKPPSVTELLWEEAERTGNTAALCAATGLIAILEAATGTKPMPFKIAHYSLSLILPPLADGLGQEPMDFLRFALQLAETRLSPDFQDSIH
jgi:hypothetical protein